MKNDLIYQSTEYDCGPTTVINAIRFLFERKEIPPALIKGIWTYCNDTYGDQGHAGKPSTRGLEAAMERSGTDRAHTAMLGDKLLTDMLAANRAGVLALMVEPVGGAVTAWQKVLHALQEPFKAVCKVRMARKR